MVAAALLRTTVAVEADTDLLREVALDEVALALREAATVQEVVSVEVHHHQAGTVVAVVGTGHRAEWDPDLEARLLQVMAVISTTAVLVVHHQWTDNLRLPQCRSRTNLSQEGHRPAAISRLAKLSRWMSARVAHQKFNHLKPSHTVSETAMGMFRG